MLSGNKYPQNIRALRMVAEIILRSVISTSTNYGDLMAILEDRSRVSRTTRLWVDNLIKQVFIMMAFVRAKREEDWPLHLWAAIQMIPYFFSSGYFNYSRYVNQIHVQLHVKRLLPTENL